MLEKHRPARCCCKLREVRISWDDRETGERQILQGTDMSVRLDGYGMPNEAFAAYQPVGVHGGSLSDSEDESSQSH